MQRFIVERLLLMVPTFIAIAALIFFTIQLPPGDYLSNEIAELQSQGDSQAAAKVEYLRKEYALDRPMVEQFCIWLGVWPGPRVPRSRRTSSREPPPISASNPSAVGMPHSMPSAA